jgi:hypothetical protein
MPKYELGKIELPITKSRPCDYGEHFVYMGWYYKRDSYDLVCAKYHMGL